MFSCRVFSAATSQSSGARRPLPRAAVPALGLLALLGVSACQDVPTRTQEPSLPSTALGLPAADQARITAKPSPPSGVVPGPGLVVPGPSLTVIPGMPDLAGVCGRTVTGVAFDGTHYYVAEGGNINMCISRYTSSGTLVDKKTFFPDFRGLHYVPALANLVGGTFGGSGFGEGRLFLIDYEAGTSTQLNSYHTHPENWQSQVAVDPDGLSYWKRVGDQAEQYRLSDNVLLKSFAVTGDQGHAPAIAVTDRHAVIQDGSNVRFYDKGTGAFFHSEPMSASVLGCSGYGFGASADGGKVMYAVTCRSVRVETTSAANQPPTADAGGPYTGSAGTPVQFDGSASSDADGDSLSYLWDFGDGSIGTGPTPRHTYSENGPYTVTLTVADFPGASATDTTSVQIGHKVVLTVTGSPPVPGVVVTAVKATGADGSGEYQVQLTDAAGQATFYLSDAGWLFHARNIGDRGLDDGGFFLARAPLPEGQGLLQTGTTEGVNHVGVFYDPAGANTSVTYNPENLERLTANPVLLGGGSSAREIGLDFEAGATVTCDLRGENGEPLAVPAPENVFLIVPHREGARLPPLPAGIPGADLPRAMLVSAATIQAGASTCSLAGVPSSDGYETAPVLETNPILVNGEEKIFVQAVEVTQAEASSGSTVQTLIVAEPKRARLEYVEDAWDDTRGDGDLGLLSYGWTLQNEQVSDVFALAAHVRGESQYALHVRYTDPATGREQSIRSTVEWDAGEEEWRVVEQTPRRVPPGVEVQLTGHAKGSGAELEGTAIWRVTLPGVDELEFRAIGGVGGRFDFAPDRDFRRATKPTGSGNTWLVGVSEED